MRSAFVYFSSRLKQMPTGLHLLILLAMFAPVLALGLHYRLADIRGASQVHVGLPKVLLIAICSALFIYGVLRATRWSRPLVVLWLAGSSIWAIFLNHTTYSFSDYLGLLLTDGFIVWILYFQRGVRDYYASARKLVV
jgi:hypothetical protein